MDFLEDILQTIVKAFGMVWSAFTGTVSDTYNDPKVYEAPWISDLSDTK